MMTEKLIATATRAASLLIVLTALGAGTLPAVAQKTSTVSNEPAGGVLTADGQSVENYCFYSAPRELQTAAPRGYRPFSIQHFGRYGSKYIGVYTGFDAVIKQLKEADSRRLLTDTGRRVKNELAAVLHAAEGRFGDLSPQGFVEQHDIAERMFHNFPEVFADTARVSASSFIISRDALSMGAAVHKLVCLNPSLRFTVRAKLRDAKLLEPYSDNFDFIELGKLAIDYSDGIVQADKMVNKQLLDYAREKNIPVLAYKAEGFAEACDDFYNQIAPEDAPEGDDD